MKESKLKVQSTAMKLSTKTSTRLTLSPKDERKTLTGQGEIKEDTLCIQAGIEGKQNSRSTNRAAHLFTNAAFPLGFTPSQCALLASRQRNSNYLYFKASNNWEKSKPYSNETTSVSSTPDLRSSLRHEVEAKGVKSPSKLLAPINAGRKNINEKTGLTGYFKWKSKEEVAKYLAAHAQARLLWIQESEKMDEDVSNRRNDFNLRLSEKIRSPLRNPVYLFNKDSKKRF
ncbi:uncharacterized protein LOC116302080 isoform X2 [Actinia tenebrosa]|nr:uncharacterized protein LOC116302080 isoform X2 [Actinia tenebrosa]XP_031567139.1 uncharacterized protein LOC116302080 isoform X2 [Actinia tenebrosa]XP_031567140.1 uncharacterized protein LOC116302080 isoform X2 [Actinia tenebrosa]